jgi:hypothetical protein
MNKNTLHKILFLTALIVGSISDAFAAQEHFFNCKSGKHFAADSSLTVQDDKLEALYGAPLKRISR